jgi:quercetin dioxygenase-like cupin family protein
MQLPLAALRKSISSLPVKQKGNILRAASRYQLPAASRFTTSLGRSAMLTRRLFATCALCAVTGFVATDADAQAGAPATSGTTTPGVKRIILQQADGPMEGYVTIIVQAEVEPGAMIVRHTHPGIESGYVIEGGGDFGVEGQANRRTKPGDGFQVIANTPHSFKNGDTATKLAITYVVEKGKPLASPA